MVTRREIFPPPDDPNTSFYANTKNVFCVKRDLLSPENPSLCSFANKDPSKQVPRFGIKTETDPSQLWMKLTMNRKSTTPDVYAQRTLSSRLTIICLPPWLGCSSWKACWLLWNAADAHSGRVSISSWVLWAQWEKLSFVNVEWIISRNKLVPDYYSACRRKKEQFISGRHRFWSKVFRSRCPAGLFPQPVSPLDINILTSTKADRQQEYRTTLH